MAGGPVKRVAKAIRDQDKQTADYGVREVEFADVRQVSPLLLELHDANIELEEEDLILSQNVKSYDNGTGILAGDTLAVKRMRDGNFLVLDVFSDTTPPSSVGLPAGGTEGQILAKDTDADYDAEWIDNYTDDLRIICKNDSGVTIPKGKAVMAVGATGDRIRIAKALNDGTIDAKYMLGIASAEITNGSEGYVNLLGNIAHLNTSAYTVGTILYISPSTAGDLTSTVPTAPRNDLAIAIVTRQHAISGRIFVRMWSQGQHLAELYDINLTSLANGQIITYDSTSGTWINSASPYPRANHTGTQTASTISDLETTVRGYGASTSSQGTVQLAGDLAGTAASPQIASGAVSNTEVASNAALALSKLASGTSGQIIVANSSGVPTYVAMSGDSTVATTGAITVKKFTGPGLGGDSITDIAWGEHTFTISAAATASTTVSIPWGTFTPSNVQATIASAANWSAQAYSYGNTSGNGTFTLRVRQQDGATGTLSLEVRWLAVR